MVSIPKIIGVISCSAVLCLSLSNATQAGMKHDPCADRKGGLVGSGGACNSCLQYSRRRLKPQCLPRTLIQA